MTLASRLFTKAVGHINNGLHNVHPGDVLHYDFGIGEEIEPAEIAHDTGIEVTKINALVHREISVDADIDLRLGRYFRLPDGYFLRMQVDYDLERMHNLEDEDLIKITPRAI